MDTAVPVQATRQGMRLSSLQQVVNPAPFSNLITSPVVLLFEAISIRCRPFLVYMFSSASPNVAVPGRVDRSVPLQCCTRVPVMLGTHRYPACFPPMARAPRAIASVFGKSWWPLCQAPVIEDWGSCWFPCRDPCPPAAPFGLRWAFARATLQSASPMKETPDPTKGDDAGSPLVRATEGKRTSIEVRTTRATGRRRSAVDERRELDHFGNGHHGQS